MLLLCRDTTLPLVSMDVCVKGGLRLEDKNNNGISNLTAQMLMKGTILRNEDDIFSFIESIGGDLSAYSGNNTMGVSLDILSRDLKKGIGL